MRLVIVLFDCMERLVPPVDFLLSRLTSRNKRATTIRVVSPVEPEWIDIKTSNVAVVTPMAGQNMPTPTNDEEEAEDIQEALFMDIVPEEVPEVPEVHRIRVLHRANQSVYKTRHDQRVIRVALKTDHLKPVKSIWRPRLKPMESDAWHRQRVQSKAEYKAMGLPRNCQPVLVVTKYRQYELDEGRLERACVRPRDRRLLTLIQQVGRIVPSDDWRTHTLVRGNMTDHDQGTFVALDLLLVSFMVNFYIDMRQLLQNRRRKIRIKDVHYLFENIWTRRVMNTAKTYLASSSPLFDAQ